MRRKQCQENSLSNADSFLISIDFVFYENKPFLYCILHTQTHSFLLASETHKDPKFKKQNNLKRKQEQKLKVCNLKSTEYVFICMFC